MNKLHIDQKYCKGCHICIHFCPANALKIAHKMNGRGYFLPVAADMKRCTACFLCERICPDFAIAIEEVA